MASTSSNEWVCPSCTVLNPIDNETCFVCGTPRPLLANGVTSETAPVNSLSTIAPDLLYPLPILPTQNLDEMLLRQQNTSISEDELITEQKNIIREYPYIKPSDVEKYCRLKYIEIGFGFDYPQDLPMCITSHNTPNTAIPDTVTNRYELANYFYEQFVPSKTMFRQTANGGKRALFGKYMPFTLTGKITRRAPNQSEGYSLIRPSTNISTNKCTQLGWPQRADDCWIDSYFYAIFMNDRISPLINKLFDNIVYNNEHDSYEYKIVRLINMYLHLLKEKANIKLYSDLKQTIKFCICAFGYQLLYDNNIQHTHFGITLPEHGHDIQFNKSWPIMGGDAQDLVKMISIICKSYVNYKHIGMIMDDDAFIKKYCKLGENIQETVVHKNTLKINIEMGCVSNENLIYNVKLNIIDAKSIDFNNLERIFMKTNNSYYSLEAISVAQGNHQTTYTKCNGEWRFYDNQGAANNRSSLQQRRGYAGNSTYVNIAEITTIPKRELYSRLNYYIHGKTLYLIYAKDKTTNLTKGGRRTRVRSRVRRSKTRRL